MSMQKSSNFTKMPYVRNLGDVESLITQRCRSLLSFHGTRYHNFSLEVAIQRQDTQTFSNAFFCNSTTREATRQT